MFRTLARQLALLSLFAGSTWSQTQFGSSELREYLPLRDDFSRPVASADVDGDGDLDLYVGVSRANQEDQILLNDGNAVFTPAPSWTLPDNVEGTTPALFGDFDGDGDPDLLFGAYLTGLYLNDGFGTFVDVSSTHLPGVLAPTSAMAAGDVDGDGDLDLFLTTPYTQLPRHRLFQNDGNAVFTDVSATSLPLENDDARDVELFDVDGDGDLDAVLAYWGLPNRLFLNDGGGTFTDATAMLMPPDADYSYCLSVGDVDGDGAPDLFVGDFYGNDSILLNNGSGTFSTFTGALPAGSLQTFEAVFGDLDGDLDLDLVLSKLFGQDRLLLNDGTGVFTDATASGMPTLVNNSYSLLLEDFDADGDLDLINGNGVEDRLYLNNGEATFVNATPVLFPWQKMGSVSSIAVDDLDLDGDLDVLVGVGEFQAYGTYNHLYRNDGNAGFVHSLFDPGVTGNTRAIVTGDVDGDGDADVLFGDSALGTLSENGRAPIPLKNRLYLNDGAGGLTLAPAMLPEQKDETTALALGDVDADGDLDLVVGNGSGQQNRLYLNDGSGLFTNVTAGRMPTQRHSTNAVLLVDIDGDVDLDLIAGNWNDQSRLYENNGHGFFTDVTVGGLPSGNYAARALAAGDVDGDGDNDLLMSKSDGALLYLNDGSGVFTDATHQLPPLAVPVSTVEALALADIDADDDLDILVGRWWSNTGVQNALLLNDGAGNFTDASNLFPAGEGGTTAFAIADMDGDGDADLLEANMEVEFPFDRPSRYFPNLQHHLRTPRMPLLGRNYVAEYHSMAGYGVAPRLALGAYSSALLPNPVTLAAYRGRLHLSFPLVFFPAAVIPAGSSFVRQELPIPSSPSLAGTTIFIQAAILGAPSGPALTGYAEETFGL